MKDKQIIAYHKCRKHTYTSVENTLTQEYKAHLHKCIKHTYISVESTLTQQMINMTKFKNEPVFQYVLVIISILLLLHRKVEITKLNIKVCKHMCQKKI